MAMIGIWDLRSIDLGLHWLLTTAPAAELNVHRIQNYFQVLTHEMKNSAKDNYNLHNNKNNRQN